MESNRPKTTTTTTTPAIAPLKWEKELCDAVTNNDLPAFKTVLARDEVRSDGDTGRNEWKQGEDPLHRAFLYGRSQMIPLLKQAGFDINSFVIDGEARYTCLHAAVLNKQGSIVKFLLNQGADWRLEGKSVKMGAGTPLEWARKKGYKDVVRIIEEHIEPDTSFQKLDAMAKLMLKSKKEQALEEAVNFEEEIEVKTIQSKELQEEIVKTEEKLVREKKRLEVLLKEVAELKSKPNYIYKGLLRRHLEEIEAISTSLRGIIPPSQTTCPICYVTPQQVFCCQECDNWVCQTCKDKVVACPSCRKSFRFTPPKRSRAVERALGIV